MSNFFIIPVILMVTTSDMLLHALRAGEACFNAQSQNSGVCIEIERCIDVLLDLQRGQSQAKDVICGWISNVTGNYPYVCCTKSLAVRTSISKIDASAPPYYYQITECSIYPTKARSIPVEYNYDYYDPNDDNRTTNFSDYYPYIEHELIPVSAGHDAAPFSTTSMALLGQKDGDSNDWFCDGVLISYTWILTAAHCLARTPNVVRLGEYNIEQNLGVYYDDSMDYDVKQIVVYPDYKLTEAYHDLALIELNTSSYDHYFVRPICLPFPHDNEFPDLVGENVTIMGWGATVFGGKSSSILQEADITIFDTEICRKSYSTLNDFIYNWPQGMTKHSTLCAGDDTGGKDSCKGDSGGPLVYWDYNDARRILGGIVSKGYGCGLNDFPGIYIPLHNEEYLSWIKKTVF